LDQERARVKEAEIGVAPWRRWGPYLSERQWGTVREDLSEHGNSWEYFDHDQARSRTYRWGEDGIAGLSDDKQYLCFAVSLWNAADLILKERLFGLTNSEGNHGEDVKEYYYYLDNTPTHSYMQFLYKYPQTAYPYNDLLQTNRHRSRTELEYELIDTGVFDSDRYFDVAITYAKAAPEDILIEITATNRGDVTAPLHLLPTLWFRNIWAWGAGEDRGVLIAQGADETVTRVLVNHRKLGELHFCCDGAVPLLFTENETNTMRLFGQPNASAFVKDGIHEHVVNGRDDSINPEQRGTKLAAHYQFAVPAGDTVRARLRLSRDRIPVPFDSTFEDTFVSRCAEADTFYAAITPQDVSADERLVMRQALAGMLWTKQYYFYDVRTWRQLPGPERERTLWRNHDWYHMVCDDVISMPDKWEYPWFAAWDLAFHCVPLAMVDPDFAKRQLELMLRESYMHPNGQIPAYEWNFSDVNPPVHPWASYYVYMMDKEANGVGDIAFLRRSFLKLLMNFTWWVNRKDSRGKNVFEGGFLGLDNISVFDRSAPLPTGGSLDQVDGTAWMAFYSVMMMQMAIELAQQEPVYEELACKFYEHFLWIGAALGRGGQHHDAMWDEEDGFFYDVLRLADGSVHRLKVRSLVGLLPLCANLVLSPEELVDLPKLRERAIWFAAQRPTLTHETHSPLQPGPTGRFLLGVLDEARLRRILRMLLDETEFLGPFGIRSVSAYHRDHPFVYRVDGCEYRVDYEPAESSSGFFGGNSNWRGPIWLPMNILIIRGLIILHRYYGNGFLIECPTASGNMLTLWAVAGELARRLKSIFLKNEAGKRPVFGGADKFQTDPHWRDQLLFYEYFHGDNGAGIGASHQTGWTGLVASLIQALGWSSAEANLAPSIRRNFAPKEQNAARIDAC
jgi:hypothetical protein